MHNLMVTLIIIRSFRRTGGLKIVYDDMYLDEKGSILSCPGLL